VKSKDRATLEMFETMLSKASKGASKWDLQAGFSSAQLNRCLHQLLEFNMLRADESCMKICRDGQLRGVIYYTTPKGKRFLEQMNALKLLLRKD